MNDISYQAPYSVSNLINVRDFVKYCNDNGVYADLEMLEKLHSHKILYPCIRVSLGYSEYRYIKAKFDNRDEWRYVYVDDVEKSHPEKISPKKYFSPNPVCTSALRDKRSLSKNMSWIDGYIRERAISYPASTRYFSWDPMWESPEFTENNEDLKKRFELFYDKNQIFALKAIYKYRYFSVNSEQQKDRRKWIVSRISEIYRFISTYYEIEKLLKECRDLQNKYYKEIMKTEDYDKNEIKEELRAYFRATLYPKFHKKAKVLSRKNEMQRDDLISWRSFLVSSSLMGESGRSSIIVKKYLGTAKDTAIIQAEDVNSMIDVLNQFIFFFDGNPNSQPETIISTLTNINEFRTCSMCGRAYKPYRTNQKTCASEQCVILNKYEQKNKQRGNVI